MRCCEYQGTSEIAVHHSAARRTQKALIIPHKRQARGVWAWVRGRRSPSPRRRRRRGRELEQYLVRLGGEWRARESVTAEGRLRAGYKQFFFHSVNDARVSAWIDSARRKKDGTGSLSVEWTRQQGQTPISWAEVIVSRGRAVSGTTCSWRWWSMSPGAGEAGHTGSRGGDPPAAGNFVFLVGVVEVGLRAHIQLCLVPNLLSCSTQLPHVHM